MRSAALLLLLAGCQTFSTIGRARTLAPKKVELFAAPDGLVVPTSGALAGRPIVELGARVGVTDRVDLEARLFTFGAEAAARVQLLRGGPVDLVLAPAAAFTQPDKLGFHLPLLIGINLPHDNQLIITPRLIYQLEFGIPDFPRPISFLFGGVSFGFAWRWSAHVTFLPELALLTQLYSEPGFTSNVVDTVGMQLSFAFLYDF